MRRRHSVLLPLLTLAWACGGESLTHSGGTGGDSGNSGSNGSGARAGAPNGADASGTGQAGGTGGVDTMPGAGAGGVQSQGSSGDAGMPAAVDAPPLPPLDVHAPNAAAECAPEACTVVSDWDAIDTNNHGSGEFRIATSADTTYVALETYDGSLRRWLLALDERGGLPLEARLALPFLTVDAQGSLHAVGGVPQPPGMSEPLREEVLAGATWSGDAIELPYGYGATGFEIDLAGRSILPLRNNSWELVLATREEGTWSSAASPVDGEATFTLDVTGKPVFFLPGSASFSIYDAAGAPVFTQALPKPATHSYGLDMATFAAPQPKAIAAGSPDLALVLLLDDGLHVVLADPAGDSVDVPIPDTRTPPFACPLTVVDAPRDPPNTLGDECAPPCVFMGSGLAPSYPYDDFPGSTAFALARTGDGTLWLAYVISDLDLSYKYSWWPDQGGVRCGADGGSGEVSSVLHVARIAVDGSSVTEALSAPLGPSVGWARPSPTRARGVAARAFGQRVAVGVAHSPSSSSAGVRVITIDAVE